MREIETILYPPIESYETGFLEVTGGHQIAYELSGNPEGKPVVFLHGGPGSGCNGQHRRFFDPSVYHIILFDQRGSGRSIPHGSIENNCTRFLVEDIERLRIHLVVDKWIIFGGSWGATLALAYAGEFSSRCAALILRGVWLARAADNQWFMSGIRSIFPDVWNDFEMSVPEHDRSDMFAAYSERLFNEDPAVNRPAARAWSKFESLRSTLLPADGDPSEWSEHLLSKTRINFHYASNLAFLSEGELLRSINRFRHVPTIIIHGRYDMVCQLEGAFTLAQAWPEAKFIVVPGAGHSAFEPAICELLVKATDEFKTLSY